MEPIIYWIIFAAVVLAQVLLSRKHNKFFGLLIPAALLLVVLYIAIVTAIYYNAMLTSFPLDALIFLNTLMYLPPLILTTVIYFVCLSIKKRRAK